MSRGALPWCAWRAARLRSLAILAAFALPWLVAIAAAVARIGDRRAATLVLLASTAALAAIAALRWRRLDVGWLVHALNARPDMEDSADLLVAARTPLQQLQRTRLQQRLAEKPADLRAAWPWRTLAASLLLALACLAVACGWPSSQSRTDAPAAASTARPANAPIRLLAARLDAHPPAYTGLPARSGSTLSTRAPRGSRLHWSLRLSGQPASVELVFLDGRRLPLRHGNGDWTADLRLDASALYRVEIDGVAEAATPHRLDASADRAPQLRVLAPTQTLTLATPQQRSWTLAFEASDDYGIASAATLRITLAQGSGENITFREQRVVLQGQGPPTRRRYSHRVDLAQLQLAAGDDLIVQLTARDNRSPQPQAVRSPSLILRLQAEPGNESTGIEGIVKRVLPAYFRSQRQIIIDAEALQKKRRTLDAGRFLRDADAIGVDQRILRLRYGQFLGEEAEGGPTLPVADASPTADSDGDAGGDGAEHADHGHAGAAAPAMGQATDVLEAYGHTHDHAEAATLLDPDTRATLKQALDQMWQSELQLRQGHPDRALPHAYKALGFIKQVQQASRIYLARVGTQLPPIDESRRLGGKRDGIAPRPDALRPASGNDNGIAALWRALGEPPDADTPGTLAALHAWLRDHPGRAADPLSVQAAIDALQRDPGCRACRDELRRLLWPLLPVPPATVPRRAAEGAQGRLYLEALDGKGPR